MITWKWKNARTGEPLTKIRVTHTLDHSDLAYILLTHTATQVCPLTELSKGELEERIRYVLHWNRGDVDFWSDHYATDEYDLDDLFVWAQQQVAKL